MNSVEKDDFDVDDLVMALEANPDAVIDPKDSGSETAADQLYRNWQTKLREFEQCRDKERENPKKCSNLAEAVFRYGFTMCAHLASHIASIFMLHLAINYMFFLIHISILSVPNNAKGIDREWKDFDDCASRNPNEPTKCVTAFRSLWRQYQDNKSTASHVVDGRKAKEDA